MYPKVVENSGEEAATESGFVSAHSSAAGIILEAPALISYYTEQVHSCVKMHWEYCLIIFYGCFIWSNLGLKRTMWKEKCVEGSQMRCCPRTLTPVLVIT